MNAIPYAIEKFRAEWRHLHDPPPRILFHYTDAHGLRGIIATGELWASHVDYVNDAQEFKYARKVILDRFDFRIQESPPGDSAKIEKLRRAFYDHSCFWHSIADIYIACFCEDGDLLSQWRAYASRGQGFALGFDPERASKVVDTIPELSASSRFFRVIYEVPEQERWVNLAIDRLLGAFATNLEVEVLNAVPWTFSEMPFSFKHPAFREEKEWRLACTAQPSLEKIVNVRDSEGRLLPYMAIPVCVSGSESAFREVIHGPTTDKQNTEQAVKMLIGKIHPAYRTEIKVSGSDAPLRRS